MATSTIGEVGDILVRNFAWCTRYAIEFVVPVAPDDWSPALRLGHAAGMLETLVRTRDEHVTLRSIAAYLRLNPREPFVYGVATEMFEDQSMSLRFEPYGSGGRIMLVYRVEL